MLVWSCAWQLLHQRGHGLLNKKPADIIDFNDRLTRWQIRACLPQAEHTGEGVFAGRRVQRLCLEEAAAVMEDCHGPANTDMPTELILACRRSSQGAKLDPSPVHERHASDSTPIKSPQMCVQQWATLLINTLTCKVRSDKVPKLAQSQRYSWQTGERVSAWKSAGNRHVHTQKSFLLNSKQL